jgi:thiol:disulfide interchange protein
VFLGKIVSFLLFFVFSSILQLASSKVVVRTSACDLSRQDSLFVAFDFEIGNGEHLTAPIGKGKSVAPRVSWENAKVVNVFWPKSEQLLDSDGQKSGYWGYGANFSVIYHLNVEDKMQPVKYNLFYVVCGDSCVQSQSEGVLELNGALSDEEVQSVVTPKLPCTPKFSLLVMILCAIVGGLIMNCMPCVFPVISIKIFSILKSAMAKETEVRRQCICFSAGTVSIFLLLGAVLVLLREVVPNIGWGFYMQSPLCIFLLLLVFLLCSLHFFEILNLDFFKIKRMKISAKSAYVTSFCNGALCGIVSSSCVGPFVGIAVASAVLYGNFIQSMTIFSSFGIGLSLPFLLISLFPRFVNKFPKPGEWLVTFKKLMGFAMLFSCIWPIWILMSQVSNLEVILSILSIISIAMFCWMLKQAKFSKIVSVAGLAISFFYGVYNLMPSSGDNESIAWKVYSDEVFDNAKLEKLPIFLNFTASWCLNCQFNERLFDDKNIAEYFHRNNVVAIKCDWTNRNEKINALMREHGAVALPFYVYYPGDDKDYVILPSMLTKVSLLSTLNGQRNGK